MATGKSSRAAVASTTSAHNMKAAKFLIFFGFLDTTAVCIVLIQIMPRILSLGASPILTGFIGAIYGGVQLISSSKAGHLCDTSDRKKLLIVVLLASSASYYLLGYQSLVTFAISRFLLGVFKQSQLLAQTCIIDFVPASEKEAYFGYFQAGFGLGFIVGPALSGNVAEWENGFAVLATLTALTFLFNAGLIWMFLPDLPRKPVTPSSKSDGKDSKKKSSEAAGVVDYFNQLGLPHVWDMLVLVFLSEVSVNIFFSSLIEIMTVSYQLTFRSMGYLFSMTAIIGMVMAIASGRLTRLIGNRLIPICMTLEFVSLLVISRLPSIAAVVLCLLHIFGSVALLRCMWPGLVSSRSTADKSGAMAGLAGSVMAVAGMLGPIGSGIATEAFGSANGASVLALVFAGLGLVANVWLPLKSKVKTS